MNIGCYLADRVQSDRTLPALFHGKTRIATYGEWHARVAELAGQFRALGCAPGDRVGLFFDNHPDYFFSLFAIWYAGLVAVPINARLHPREVSWILQHSGAKLCLTKKYQKQDFVEESASILVLSPNDLTLADPAIEHPEDRGPDDLAWLFYTSGTTGRPKGVQITHGMLRVMSESYLASVDEVSSADATLYAAPMSHGAGLYALVHVLRGARHVVPVSGGFDAEELLELAAHFGRAHLFAAPTMLVRLTAWARDAKNRGNGLRCVVLGGGPLYEVDLRAALDQFGPVFAQIYGQGEAPMGITALGREDIAEGKNLTTVGRAQEGISIKITGHCGENLTYGKVGEIEVKGDLVMPGYWRNEKASTEALRDGWLRTGDLGWLDDAGYLTLVDRSKDVVISGGQNIYPREVEEVLLSHPDVGEVSVVGRASETWGEEVVAFVVTTRDASETTLDAHCLNQIARFKRPKAYYFVADLPKNSYGKVLKTKLRESLVTK